MIIDFIILNFNTYEETVKCIEAIKRLKNNNNIVNILVVDNCSTQKKNDEWTKYSKDIMYVPLEYNVGFAKANNIGYTISKYLHNPDFIIFLNSDVYIKQIDFIEKLVEIANEHSFEILGPDILTMNDEHQNPVRQSDIHDDLYKIKKTILKNKLRYLFSFVPIYKKRVNSYQKKEKIENIEIGKPLHGSCLIFSKAYISMNEFAFYPDTFLYGEEDILYYLSKVNNHRLLYHPELQVLHAEDASTNKLYKNLGNKKRFIIKHANHSLKILKELMKEE